VTTDPEKFEPQGKPTKEQVRTVWDAHPKPSARTIAELMKNRGFKISWRTVARWQEQGWREELAASTPFAERDKPKRAKKEVKAAIAKEKPEVVAEAGAIAEAGGLKAAIEGGALTDADYLRIDGLIKELGTKELADLKAIQEKDRTIMNIVLMREATRRAHIMTLIPKDTSSLIGAFTDDAKVMAPTAPIQPVDGQKIANGQMPMIEGEFKVVNPTTSAIQRYLAKENAA
jgi:hypothetical protein